MKEKVGNPSRGGKSIEKGGDGTGFAGGIDYSYWKDVRRHLKELEAALGRPPILGVDFPTDEQMNLKREYLKRIKNNEIIVIHEEELLENQEDDLMVDFGVDDE